MGPLLLLLLVVTRVFSRFVALPSQQKLENSYVPTVKKGLVSFIPEKTKDPRLLYKEKFQKNYGVNSVDCPGVPNFVMSKEYEVSSIKRCPPYWNEIGFTIFPKKKPSKVIYWVEIMKSGSSSVKDMLEGIQCSDHRYDEADPLDPILFERREMGRHETVNVSNSGTEAEIDANRESENTNAEVHADANSTMNTGLEEADKDEDCVYLVEGIVPGVNYTNATAFAIVRHPIERFISGYGTLVRRIAWSSDVVEGQNKAFTDLRRVIDLKEPERFATLVKHYTTKGLDLLASVLSSDAHPGFEYDSYEHLLSQTWFMSRFPGEINYVGKLRTLDRDLEFVFKNLIGPQYTINAVEYDNADEGAIGSDSNISAVLGIEEYLRQRHSIEALNEFFKEELELFGYDPL